MNISAVIPCFNDGAKLSSIVDELQKYPKVKEIVVVDDGSLQKTKKAIAQISGIEIVTHASNQGKTKALLSGLNKVSGELVLFIDSDLHLFSKSHVEAMYKKINENSLDLVLGMRENEIFYMKWCGFAQAYTGERLIKRSLLMKHPEFFSVKNYLIEPAMNRFFFHNKKVGGVTLKNLTQTYKFQKNGIVGLIKDFQMYLSYLEYLGYKEFMFQLNFARTLKI